MIIIVIILFGLIIGIWIIDFLYFEVGFVVCYMMVSKVKGCFSKVFGIIMVVENVLEFLVVVIV